MEKWHSDEMAHTAFQRNHNIQAISFAYLPPIDEIGWRELHVIWRRWWNANWYRLRSVFLVKLINSKLIAHSTHISNAKKWPKIHFCKTFRHYHHLSACKCVCWCRRLVAMQIITSGTKFLPSFSALNGSALNAVKRRWRLLIVSNWNERDQIALTFIAV